jgi:hypothetical protein
MTLTKQKRARSWLVCFLGAVDPCDVGSVMAIHRLVPVYSEVQAFLTRRAELWALTR